MRTVTVLGLVLVSVTLVACVRPVLMHEKYKVFRDWMKQYGKTYESADVEMRRFHVFSENMGLIDFYNLESSKVQGAKYGLTKFADLSPEEFKATYLTAKRNLNRVDADNVLDTSNLPEDVPKSFDWNTKGAVTPVKDQGMCGSCWAFSTTETIESAWFLAGHKLPILTEQQIVDCDTVDDGCGGGDTVTAYQYVMQAGGLETEDEYPYTGENDQCAFQKKDVVATISNWKYVIPLSSHNETIMGQVLVAKGPLSICVDAASWQFYIGGIIRVLCGNDLDHCVQITGYSTESSDFFGETPYWIIRNSWGTDWGYSGYVYVERYEDLCGVADHVTLPIV